MNRLFVITTVFALSTSCLGGDIDASLSREAWIWKTILQLRSFQPAPETPRVQFKRITYREGPNTPLIDGDGMRTSLIDGDGLVFFSTNEWLYMVVHSWHSPGWVGDICLAIDNNGCLYQNDGHPCRAIRFESESSTAPQSVREFVTCFHADMSKDELWRELKYVDPPSLPKGQDVLLEHKEYDSLLNLSPEFKKGWQAEQSSIRALQAIGVEVRLKRVAPVRLVVALPDKYGKYLERVGLVNCYTNKRMTDSMLEHMGKFSELRRLTLTETSITDASIQHLVSLKKLESLGLSKTKLTEKGLRQIATITNLRFLDVSNMAIDDNVLMSLVPLENLESLTAVDTQITLAGARRFRMRRPKAQIHMFPHDHPMKKREAEIMDIKWWWVIRYGSPGRYVMVAMCAAIGASLAWFLLIRKRSKLTLTKEDDSRPTTEPISSNRPPNGDS